MAEYLVFPDIEAVCGQALHEEGLRSYSSIPKSPTYPLCTVARLGGRPPVKQALDCARIQVDAWAETKGAARDLAEEARRVLHAMEGTHNQDFNCYVTGVDDEVGLSYQPDEKIKKERYVFSVLVYAHGE